MADRVKMAPHGWQLAKALSISVFLFLGLPNSVSADPFSHSSVIYTWEHLLTVQTQRYSPWNDQRSPQNEGERDAVLEWNAWRRKDGIFTVCHYGK